MWVWHFRRGHDRPDHPDIGAPEYLLLEFYFLYQGGKDQRDCDKDKWESGKLTGDSFVVKPEEIP